VRKIFEIYSGIGGLAEAVRGKGEVVLAVDQSPLAMQMYRANFDHPVAEKALTSVRDEEIAQLKADLWWASPPCQPFTIKGRQRFLDDPRANTFLDLLGKLERIKPESFILENVPGFAQSPGREFLLEVLDRSGYPQVQEIELCPSMLGIPMYRRRYFVVASRLDVVWNQPDQSTMRLLRDYLKDAPSGYDVDDDTLRRYRYVMDYVNPDNPAAMAACFGSGYGKSISRSGSYIAEVGDRIRRFSPREVLRLLGFSEDFRIPGDFTDRQAWKLAGNSLSVDCVKSVLHSLGNAVFLQHVSG